MFKNKCGQYILMPSFTFSASANAVITAVATLFYDIKLDDLCADVDQIQNF